MSMYQVGSIVKFSGSDWGVYCQVKADDKHSELYGVSLLVAEYFARLYGMVKRDMEARQHLLSCMENPEMLSSYLEGAMLGWSEFYQTGNVEMKYDLTTTAQAKKECSFILSYDLEGHFSPTFRPKGFGLLGKNIEAASVSACLATADFFMETGQDSDYRDVVVNTIHTIAQKLLPLNKLSMLDEGKIVRETVDEVVGNRN